ncbi:carph-isopro domain-containing protein [Pararoseomonas indoligenes]|uniref:Helix-turn-helix domain-containing protein n=1 Tax=Roseomonas indoligenes TaxID=2820811 RepID=A0A940MZ07_9PROT|nr:helix-turn-helix domain-containing protein [Pararoseomonas indoligenes]
MSGHQRAVQSVVSRFGGQNALARQLGLRQSTVWGWVSKGRVPSWRIPEIIAAGAALHDPVRLTPADFFDLPSPTPRVAWARRSAPALITDQAPT